MKKHYILLKNVNLINGTKDMEIIPHIDVLINDDRIDKIAKDIPVFYEYKVIDLTGKYLVPGLINLHVHLPANGKAPWKNSNNQKLAKLISECPLLHPVGVALGKKYAKVELLSGVTSLRAVGGVSNFDGILRDKINKGKVLGPRLFVANTAVAVPHGHMVGTVAKACESLEEALQMVDDLYAQKVDLVKIMITGGVLDAEKRGEPGVLRMPHEYVKAICDKAHSYGLQVSAHVESFEGHKVALQNGVDTIEHGSDIDDEAIALYKQNGGAFVCTLSPAIPLAIFDEEVSGCNELVQYNTFVILKGFMHGVNKALANDIPVGLGTDTGCPFVTHYNFYRELKWFTKAFGVTNEKALYFATLGNASIIKKDKEIGSIEEGKFADMIVLNNNPILDLDNLKDPFIVIKDGKLINSPKVKKNEYIDQNLDKIMEIDIPNTLQAKFKEEV